MLLVVARRLMVVVKKEEKGLQEEGLLEVFWRAWCGYFWSRYVVVVLESFKRRLNLLIKPR